MRLVYSLALPVLLAQLLDVAAVDALGFAAVQQVERYALLARVVDDVTQLPRHARVAGVEEALAVELLRAQPALYVRPAPTAYSAPTIRRA